MKKGFTKEELERYERLIPGYPNLDFPNIHEFCRQTVLCTNPKNIIEMIDDGEDVTAVIRW